MSHQDNRNNRLLAKNGSIAALEEVIEFYKRGGNQNPYLDPELRPLQLAAEDKKSLLAFLRSLSGTIQEGMGNERAKNH
ncbi:hypothetical protein MYX65_10725 [Acidobacteria bacterium AH-259-L09]|nr:hypothetical protein [Acidobacteria bacterium AH-259-L09]